MLLAKFSVEKNFDSHICICLEIMAIELEFAFIKALAVK